MECSVSACREGEISEANALDLISAVYEETSTIWFSDFYDEEEEAMYKLIGVRSSVSSSVALISLAFV